MRTSIRRAALLIALAALLAPAALAAQDRAVVSKEVSVGRSQALLHLGFADMGKLTISLQSGEIVVDGHTVGSYQPGSALDSAWRGLLGQVVSLDDGALAKALRAWRPPGDLTAAQADGAKAIVSALDTALAPLPARKAAAPAAAPAPDAASADTAGSPLRALLERSGRLADLGVALRDVDVTGARIQIDQDVDIASGQTVHGALVVVDGNAKIAGTVDGDVVVVGGHLTLLPGSRVEGDVHLADASVSRDGGTVSGTVLNVRAGHGSAKGEVGKHLLSETGSHVSTPGRVGISLFAPIRRIVFGLGGILRDLFTVVILALVGAGVATFAGKNLDAVAETARRTPGRAAAVGLAGTFLLVPVWVLGIVVLTVSIVGIPVMIAWLPLFPLAAVAASLLGYLAVAHNVGHWLARSDLRFTERIRASNPIHTVSAGLLALAAAFICANFVSMVPFFGFLKGLLIFAGGVITVAAVEVGFGAVLLTRAGTRPEYGFMDSDVDVGWRPDTSSPASSTQAPRTDPTMGGDDDA